MTLIEHCNESFSDKEVVYLSFNCNFRQSMTLEEKVEVTKKKILETLNLKSMDEVPTKDHIYMLTNKVKAIFPCQGELAGFMAREYNHLQLVAEGLFYD